MSLCTTWFYKFSNFNKFNFNTILNRIKNLIINNNNSINIKMPISTEYDNSIFINDKIEEEIPLHPDFDQIVRSILVARAKEGSTIQEIREDYYCLIGEKFPYFENTTEQLLKIPNIICRTNQHGTRIFNILESEKSQHIITMVQNQKPQKYNKNFIKDPTNYNNTNFYNHNNRYYNQYKNNNNFDQSSWRSNRRSTPIEKNNSSIDYNQKYFDNGNQDNNCFFEDNYRYLRKFGLGSCETLSSKYSQGYSNWSSNSYGSNQYLYPEEEESAHIYDYQLLGDDFFLSMAKMELGCRYTTVNGVHEAGLCISGQTINEANIRIQSINKLNRRLIVNIGSVDILQGHHLVEIQHDFLNLLNSLQLRGIQPILTTLAPLANHGHRPDIRRIVERFNEFIRNLGLPYIDVWKSMANEYGNTLYDCYQSGARHVTGSNHPHVFWNKIGRQRVLNNIKSGLEYLPLDS